MCRDDVGIAMAMARVKLGIARATPEDEIALFWFRATKGEDSGATGESDVKYSSGIENLFIQTAQERIGPLKFRHKFRGC